MSVAQTWLARVIPSPRSRYGYTLLNGCLRLVFGLRYSASMPIRAISVATCRRPTSKPSRCSRSRSMREPANGSSKCSTSMRFMSRWSASEAARGRYTLARLRPANSAWRTTGRACVRSIIALRSTGRPW